MSDSSPSEQSEADLHAELQGYGLQFVGTNLEALKKIVLKLREERQERPRCFARSWEPRSPECGRCDHIDLCSDKTVICRVPSSPHDVEECDECDGDVLVELFNDKGQIIGHACSTPGCSHYRANAEFYGAK